MSYHFVSFLTGDNCVVKLMMH